MAEYAPIDMMLVTSAGYQTAVESLANDYPDVQFVQVYDYVMKDPTDRPNLHSIWATLYEARYLAGVVAGGVLPKDETEICYIRAWDNAEVTRYVRELLRYFPHPLPRDFSMVFSLAGA
jgi:basic membrane lipoprotein Med (substrate-binding protein (PBP1-ABC) superfamily)